jgi:hypothetical protein
VYSLPGWRLRFLLLPILLRFIGRHLWIRSPRVAWGLRGEGRGDLGGLGFFKRMKADRCFAWGISQVLDGLQIGSTDFTLQVTAALNNWRLGSDLLFQKGTNRQREYSEAEGSFGGFLDTLFE